MSKPTLFALAYVLIGWLISYVVASFLFWLAEKLGGKVGDGVGIPNVIAVAGWWLVGTLVGSFLNGCLGIDAGIRASYGSWPDHSILVFTLLYMTGVPLVFVSGALVLCASLQVPGKSM
jgi:hypothetical protein